MASTDFSAPIELNRLHWPVTALGYGQRIGIWFQGCSIRCPGCCSRDTWESTGAQCGNVDQILDWVERLPSAQIDGFTLSGGEPFDQPEALADLVRGLRHAYGMERDILLYTGHPWRRVQSTHVDILALVDAVISEPYLESRPATGLRGSDNQRLHCLTPLARQRYEASPSFEPRMQVHFDGETLWMIGIPQPGALEGLQQKLSARGVVLGAPSWLA